MKFIATLLFAACAAASTTHAVVSVTLSFSPTLISGEDTHGLVGSLWSVTYTAAGDTYTEEVSDDMVYVATASAFLTVSGAGDNSMNGTWDIGATSTSTFWLIGNWTEWIFVGSNGGYIGFSMGGLGPNSVSLTAGGPSPTSPLPENGSPVLASDFAGADLDFGQLIIDDAAPGYVEYTFDGIVTAVPEPSTWAALLGVMALGLSGLRCFTCRR